MKKILLQISIVLLLQIAAIGSVSAQVEGMQTTVEKFVWEDGTLIIEMKLDLNDINISTREGIELIPIISTDDSDTTLPPILMMGREHYKQYKRDLVFMSDEELAAKTEPHIIIKDFGNNQKIVNYKYTHTCVKPTAEYKLRLSNKLFACGAMVSVDANDLATLIPKPITPIFVPYLTNIAPKPIVIGTEEDRFNIYFRYDRYDVDRSYMSNSVSLNNIQDFMKEIKIERDTTIAKIVIGGYSSIEGSYKYNTALSLRRANAIYDYVFKGSKIDKSTIEFYNGTENWSDLREVVTASDMQLKAEVLAIIDSEPIDARDNKLKRLDGGTTYKYIKTNFFPKLRSSSFIKVYYKYGDKNAITINKAIDYINNKEYTLALDLLLKISDDKRAQNAIGVCYMMLDDLENAKDYLQQSSFSGNSNAQKNLDQVESRLQ